MESIDQADRYIARSAMNFIHRLQSKADGLGAFVYKTVQGTLLELRRRGLELHPFTAIRTDEAIDILVCDLQRNRPKWTFFLKAVYSTSCGQDACLCLADILEPLLRDDRHITASLLNAATLMILRNISGDDPINTSKNPPSSKGNGHDGGDKVRTPILCAPQKRESSANTDVAPYRQAIDEGDFIWLEKTVRQDIANAEGITAPTKQKADKLAAFFIEALQRDEPLSYDQGSLAERIGTTGQNFSELKRKLFLISPFFKVVLDPPRPRRRKNNKGTEHGVPIGGNL